MRCVILLKDDQNNAPLFRHSIDLEFAHRGNKLGKETQMQLLGNPFVGCHYLAVTNERYMSGSTSELATTHCGRCQGPECLGMRLASSD
jgi:hypothetical protein